MNLQVRVVVVADSNTLRGRYILAQVCESSPSSDGYEASIVGACQPNRPIEVDQNRGEKGLL